MRLLSARGVLLFFGLVGAALWAGAAEQTIEARNDGNRVVWTTVTPFETATLSIGLPDGTVVERVFSSDNAISFSPVDLEEIDAVDGLYNWQIVLSPVLSRESREILGAARESGNGDAVELLRQRGQLPAEEELVQSGSFRFASRSLVSDATVETPSDVGATKGAGAPIDLDDPTRAQVIVTDLVVQGSECVGFDCVNGESFGFDTIRLKENNLRIHFQDTSTSASFPTVDWRIVANDTSNGGANYLAFEDSSAGRQIFRVDAGGPADSLRVDSAGDVGLGTSNPVVELHVADGDTPTVRLEQNGSSGFTPQTWDLAGNETNFFVRDVTNGSKLPFKIRPGAPTNSLYIDTDGDIGLGVDAPTGRLHLTDSDPETKIKVVNTEGGGNREWAFAVSNSDEFRVSKQGSGGAEFTVQGDGTVKIGPGADTVFKLTPVGEIIISSTLTENGTPDYVFADDYDLRSIPELARFIDEHQHLPNVPSAREVAENGLDLTQFQLTLLEKIEELTLYLVDQDQLIRELQNTVQAVGAEEKTGTDVN